MKRYIFYILILFLQTFSYITCALDDMVSGFGKTHFISGYDHTKIRQQRVKNKKNKKKETFTEVFFSPYDDVCTKLCQFIAQEQERIRVAVYTLTDEKVRDALIDAVSRGVSVEVVTEKTMLLERYSKIDDLADAGVIIYAYPIRKKDEKVIKGIMHNKFMVFSRNIHNQKIVWVGSYNFTKAAREHNRESVVVLRDEKTYTRFMHEFNSIKQLSKPYKISA